MKKLVEEIKEVVQVEVRIDSDKLADKIYDKGVDKLMLKLVDIIPTEFDNAFYAAKKEELKAYFRELMDELEDLAEEKIGIDLDGEEEKDEEVNS